MKTLKIVISTFEQMRDRSIAIAKGEYKPRRGEPKIWFTTLESFARVLSERNRELLSLIAEAEPESLQELENLSGRKVSNLSRTLKKMEQYGIVSLKKASRAASGRVFRTRGSHSIYRLLQWRRKAGRQHNKSGDSLFHSTLVP